MFLFQVLVTQIFERLLQWFWFLLESEKFENPENQPKCSASLLVLKNNEYIQNLCLIKLIIMVYLIFAKDPV